MNRQHLSCIVMCRPYDHQRTFVPAISQRFYEEENALCVTMKLGKDLRIAIDYIIL